VDGQAAALPAGSAELRYAKRTRGGRERALRAASDLFRAHTLAGTSLQMIADRLGVTKAAIYHHFRSRDEIVRALMQPVLEDVAEGVERVRALPVDDRPEAARDVYADILTTHRRVIGVLVADRAAMESRTSEDVEHLILGVATLLCEHDDAVALARSRSLVYGLATLVTQLSDLDDAALRALVRAVLEPV
jgi:AcrR family transcriptional regulator